MPTYTSIAYDWILRPVSVDRNKDGTPDVTLVFTLVRDGIGPRIHVFNVSLPPKEEIADQEDVSGIMGLLWPVGSDGSENKASAFERVVADMIVWIMNDVDYPLSNAPHVDANGEAKFAEHIVLIQGPLIPKLRGRLLYRALSEKVMVYAVTYDDKWLRKLQVNGGQDWENKEGTVQVSQIRPPAAIDRGTRSWVAKTKADEKLLHFEVIANSWSAPTEKGWFTRREEEVVSMLKDVEVLGSKNIPKDLARAANGAKDAKQMILDIEAAMRVINPLLMRSAHPLKAIPNGHKTQFKRIGFQTDDFVREPNIPSQAATGHDRPYWKLDRRKVLQRRIDANIRK